MDVFVEIDDEAVKVWEEYQSIKQMKNRFERKRQLNKQKKDFYKYVLSLPEHAVRKQIEIDEKEITFISREMVCSTYDKDTGFIREIEKDYFL